MSQVILGHKTLKFIKGYYYVPFKQPFDVESAINSILENIISGGDEPLDQNILNKIANSDQDTSDINNQLEEIILSGYDALRNPENYLTFESLGNGMTVSFTNNCQYSLGTNEWFDLTAGESTPKIKRGKKVYFKATSLVPDIYDGIGTFTISKNCNVSGNCNSMLFGDEVENNLSLSGKNYTFYNLFSNCNTIIDASQLILPATTLAPSCYQGMFDGCTSLVSAPALPATALALSCYQGMFDGCTSLVSAPDLPATELAESCYSYMFYLCTSLVSAPELPAIALDSWCYYGMFQNCTSLVTAPALPATSLVGNCYDSMFSGCTSLVSAPELPAKTLKNYCYINMFNGCSKLNYIKALFTTTPSSTYTSNWVKGVSSTGTFIKNKNATWNVTGVNGIPSGWTVQTA